MLNDASRGRMKRSFPSSSSSGMSNQQDIRSFYGSSFSSSSIPSTTTKHDNTKRQKSSPTIYEEITLGDGTNAIIPIDVDEEATVTTSSLKNINKEKEEDEIVFLKQHRELVGRGSYRSDYYMLSMENFYGKDTETNTRGLHSSPISLVFHSALLVNRKISPLLVIS
jgi:hypothetical protein